MNFADDFMLANCKAPGLVPASAPAGGHSSPPAVRAARSIDLYGKRTHRLSRIWCRALATWATNVADARGYL